MTINSNRNFKHEGKRYRIENLPKQDIKDGKKYFISIFKDGTYQVCHHICGYDVIAFRTIKAAKLFVRDWDFMLDTI